MFKKFYNYVLEYKKEFLIVTLTLFSINLSLFYFNGRDEITRCHKQLKQKDEKTLLLHDSIYVMQLQYMRMENSIDILLEENPEIEDRYNEIYNHETE
jgi:hypothetical protein